MSVPGDRLSEVGAASSMPSWAVAEAIAQTTVPSEKKADASASRSGSWDRNCADGGLFYGVGAGLLSRGKNDEAAYLLDKSINATSACLTDSPDGQDLEIERDLTQGLFDYESAAWQSSIAGKIGYMSSAERDRDIATAAYSDVEKLSDRYKFSPIAQSELVRNIVANQLRENAVIFAQKGDRADYLKGTEAAISELDAVRGKLAPDDSEAGKCAQALVVGEIALAESNIATPNSPYAVRARLDYSEAIALWHQINPTNPVARRSKDALLLSDLERLSQLLKEEGKDNKSVEAEIKTISSKQGLGQQANEK